MAAASGPPCTKCGKLLSARRVTRCAFCGAVTCMTCANCYGTGKTCEILADEAKQNPALAEARGRIDEARDLLRDVLAGEDILTSKSWLRRAKLFVERR